MVTRDAGPIRLSCLRHIHINANIMNDGETVEIRNFPGEKNERIGRRPVRQEFQQLGRDTLCGCSAGLIRLSCSSKTGFLTMNMMMMISLLVPRWSTQRTQIQQPPQHGHATTATNTMTLNTYFQTTVRQLKPHIEQNRNPNNTTIPHMRRRTLSRRPNHIGNGTAIQQTQPLKGGTRHLPGHSGDSQTKNK